MLASRVPDTIVAEGSLPTIPALAFTGSVAVTVFIVASGHTNGFCAVVSGLGVVGILLPSVQADFVAIVITSVMSKLVISWAAQSVTIFTVIMIRTHDTVLVFQLGIQFLVHSMSPVGSGIQFLLGSHATYEACTLVVLMPSFNDETESPRPLEIKWELNRCTFH